MKYSIVLCVALFTLLTLIQIEVVLADGEVKTISVVRTEESPFIDGSLDDVCWNRANVATGFIEDKTERLAIEQTLVRLLYDDENIYIGFECLEPEPNRIVAVERKYDQSLRDEDRVDIRLDTFHDHRCTYIFSVNTLGTRYDARMGLFDFRFNVTWGCDWMAACTVCEDRWFAEIAIPIGNMLFGRKDGVTWGVNFRRVEKGLQENSYWYYPSSEARLPREFGHLVGLDLANVKINRRPEFETYLSSSYDIDRGRNELSTGLDISMRFNSELIGAFTINPDFGQVEADPDTIELRDTERFLQERRTFFREGSELFKTPFNIYYSRRLTDIDLGGKVTGQGKTWALGLIDIQGEIYRDDVPYKGNYHVGRFIHNVGQNSHIGIIWANASRTEGTNFTGGVDCRLFLNRTTFFTTQVLGLVDTEGIETDEETNGETDGFIDNEAYGVYMSVDGGTKPLWWHVDYRDITRGFRPDLGYIPRRDIRGPGTFLMYREDFEDGLVKWVRAMSDINLYENHDSETTLRDFEERVGMCFRNEIEIWYRRGDKYHSPFQNWYDGIRIEYNEEVDIWESISIGLERGVYEEEPYTEYSIEKPMRITDRLVTTINGNYRVNEAEEPDIWLWRWVTQYNFPWDGRIKLTAEQTSEGRHNLTVLFSWPVRDNIDLYFLFNDYTTDEEDVCGAFFKAVYRF